MITDLDRERVVAALYRATPAPRMVDVPEFTFLMIDGHGDPNISRDYQTAVQTLFTLSYAVKFAIKRSGGENFTVAPLEGLWWADDIHTFETGDKSSWNWTAMIRQPDEVTAELVDQAAEAAMTAKRLPAPASARLESFTEGRAAQILHIGPYAAEGPTIRRLHEFIAEQGGHFDPIAQKHHEIYIGDPRRAAPERLRTVIRQPVA